MSGLALLALLLTVLGVYGVVSYWVSQGTAGYGLRMALGAVPREIGVLVLRQGLTPVAIGLILGGVLASWAGSYMEALLYGVRPGDALTFAVITALLLGVTAAACLAPAWRATRVQPSVALRGD